MTIARPGAWAAWSEFSPLLFYVLVSGNIEEVSKKKRSLLNKHRGVATVTRPKGKQTNFLKLLRNRKSPQTIFSSSASCHVR